MWDGKGMEVLNYWVQGCLCIEPECMHRYFTSTSKFTHWNAWAIMFLEHDGMGVSLLFYSNSVEMVEMEETDKGRPWVFGSLSSYKCVNASLSQFGHRKRFRLSSQTRTNRCLTVTANTHASIVGREKRKSFTHLFKQKSPVRHERNMAESATLEITHRHEYSQYAVCSPHSLDVF